MKIGFIDYSREERNRILSTLRMLEEKTALDELGIGVVRDAYADKLFPGISTLQTRAKYFVLIPYIFQTARERAEQSGNRALTNAKAMMQWINEREDLLAETLMKNSPGEDGIIGVNATKQKRSVKIKPSTIYWNGMRTLGILRRSDLSIYDVCKLICASANRQKEMEIRTEDENYDDPSAAKQDGMVFLPLQEEYDYFRNSRIQLTGSEAEFLRDCILRAPVTARSLLGFFIREGKLCDSIDSVPTDKLPEDLRKDYMLAMNFARFIYGAHLRYNIIYSNGTDVRMSDEFESWRDEVLSDPIDLEAVLDNVSCTRSLKAFCDEFHNAIQQNDLHDADEIIIAREKSIKTTRAKLCKPEEYQYDPRYPVHHYRLDYRFSRARVILQDILNGLGGANNV